MRDSGRVLLEAAPEGIDLNDIRVHLHTPRAAPEATLGVEHVVDVHGLHESQLSQLRSLVGAAADRRFLTLMIAHHRGGVTMAEAIRPLTHNAAVDSLAAAIETSQRAEIAQMSRLRATL